MLERVISLRLSASLEIFRNAMVIWTARSGPPFIVRTCLMQMTNLAASLMRQVLSMPSIITICSRCQKILLQLGLLF